VTTPIASAEAETADSTVLCENSQGLKLHATLLRVSRFQAAFEVYGLPGILRMSEVLPSLRIVVQGRSVYSGRAVVSSLIQLGSVGVCEAALEEAGLDLSLTSPVSDPQALQAGFGIFMRDWGRNYRVHSEFKVVMADMQTFFLDLRLWLERLELAVRSQPAGDRLQMERDVLEEVQKPVLPAVAPVLEKFEFLANRVEADMQPAHRAYMKRQIHPLVLCSPFLFRTFQKPLGYAGDYEMVNMMMRDPFEGGSMFAKLVNRIFLSTPPVVAHQYRIDYLTQQLVAEAQRAAVCRRALRVYNLGCGPALEIQRFVANSDLSNWTEFSLLDFSDETLAHANRVLGEIKTRCQRSTKIQTVRKSVQQVLKDAGKPSAAPKYDMIYCAGLFDYLTDQVCRRLMNYFFDLLAPGGLLIATNVSAPNPSINWMEYVLDWYLVYRTAAQFRNVAPDRAPADSVSVQAIGTGVNIALEVRKPHDQH
jgi:extracellular factor (EF) 3-hydroxypalmitic acid methyl ester biosynthesis protein